MFAVLITGAPGAGKTAALTALSDALAADGIPHAAVDVDEIAWAYPPPDLEGRCAHLRAWGAPHVRTGAGLLLVAEVIESRAHRAQVLAAVEAGDHLLVELTARAETLTRRIVEREPEGWWGLAWLLEETRRLSAEPPDVDRHLVLDTERLRPPEIAERIRSAAPDRLRPR